MVASKKLGKAVVRNRVKRRLREILRHSGLKTGKDIIVIARRGAAAVKYDELQQAAAWLLRKSGLTEANEIVSPVAD